MTERPLKGSRAGVRIALLAGLATLVAFGAFMGLRVKQALEKQEALAAERAEAQASATRKVPVPVTSPVPTTWRPRVEMTGTLKPWRETDIGFETPGRLVKVNVATGDHVKAGQVLAVLDGTRAGETVAAREAAVRAAAANLALAEDNLRRTEPLVASNSLPEAQAEQARQQVALAKANLEAAKADAALARTGAGQHRIVAPFPGIVTKAPTAAGSVVQAGVPLIHLEDLSRLRLSATVGEDEVPLVREGAKARVTYRDRTVEGKVVTVVPSLDAATRRAPVEIEVPNDPKEPLLAWGFVRVVLEGDAEVPVLKVPATARRPGSQDELVKVEGGVVRIVRVVHAVADDGSWLVREGLSPTDVIVVAPNSEMKNGDPIAVAAQDQAPGETARKAAPAGSP